MSKTSTAQSPSVEALPIGLVTLAKLIDEFDPDELRRALDAAKQELAEVGGGEEAGDRLSEYIREHAEERSPWAPMVRQAIAGGQFGGDLQCAYAVPAKLAGLCIAWLMLTGGAR